MQSNRRGVQSNERLPNKACRVAQTKRKTSEQHVTETNHFYILTRFLHEFTKR